MKVSMDKCDVIHVERGRIISSENVQLINSLSFTSLNKGKTYKYLGMSEALDIDDRAMKQLIKARFFGNTFCAFGWVIPP